MIPIPTYRTRRGALLCSAAYAPYRMPWLFGPNNLVANLLINYPHLTYGGIADAMKNARMMTGKA